MSLSECTRTFSIGVPFRLLLALGPVFVLDAPNSLYMFPFIGIYIAHQDKHYCDADWIVVESGSL